MREIYLNKEYTNFWEKSFSYIYIFFFWFLHFIELQF